LWRTTVCGASRGRADAHTIPLQPDRSFILLAGHSAGTLAALSLQRTGDRSRPGKFVCVGGI
jgi:hypothetical protein